MLNALSFQGRFFEVALLIGIVLGPATAGADDTGLVSAASELLQLERPVVIAHRGYNQFAPENTLPSFKLAKSAGADLVELDYHHTLDGVPVVIHDAELDRTTDAVALWGGSKIRVDGKNMSELRALDAGRWFDARFEGTPLSTLSEALDFIQDGNVTLIERKAGDAATCVKLLREKSLINKVVVQSFDWTYLKDFHALEPGQVLAALGPPWSRSGKKLEDPEKILDRTWVDEIKESGARIVVWSRQITPEAVAYAHQQGMRVWVYTIDEPQLANEMLDMGADGIISNNVSLIWRTIAVRSPQMLL
jgi:glycerophosphoryl diester phosphodiesterase